MDDQSEAITAQAAIMGDVGANLVAVLVILLVALGLTRGLAPAAKEARQFPALISAPLSGKAQSDILYQRLRPGADVLVVELTAAGAFVAQREAMMPLAQLDRPWPPVAVVFLFSAAHYASFRQRADAEGIDWVEVTVPQVLRRQGADAGVSAFSSAFLGIRVGSDPASLRPPLLRLLQSRQGGAGGADLDETATRPAPQLFLASVAAWLRMGGNLLLLGIAVALLFALRRRMA